MKNFIPEHFLQEKTPKTLAERPFGVIFYSQTVYDRFHQWNLWKYSIYKCIAFINARRRRQFFSISKIRKKNTDRL